MDQRAHFFIRGSEREAFLQDLISQDVSALEPGALRWGALLTPQGRLVADFFLHAPDSETWWLDVHADFAPALTRQLKLYKLRRDVELSPAEQAWVLTLPNPLDGALQDPRHPQLGVRLYGQGEAPSPLETPEAYALRRIQLGVPEGPEALPPGEAMLIDSGFVELHGLSVNKGCYVGQEVTARVYFRGLVKRRLLPVHTKRQLVPGESLLAAGKALGQIREAGPKGWGLALVRQEALDQSLALDDGTEIQLKPPAWLRWNPKPD